MNRHSLICEKLKKLGYASERRIRLYGEELHLISNPIHDGEGFSVAGVVLKSGNIRHIRIPLTVVNMLEREIKAAETANLAA
jgi:hypothetical protein